MFRKILVPVDMTDRHERTLVIAADLATWSKGELTLLHVVQEIHGLSQETGLYERLEDAARVYLDKQLAKLRGRVTAVRGEIRIGDRGPEVIRYAREISSDLIVLTSHPVDPASPAADWASFSHLIGIASPCPVLLVK
jgi:nucleotide-binding universal stress UspA family protein